MSRKKLPGGGWEDVADLDLRAAETNSEIVRRFVPPEVAPSVNGHHPDQAASRAASGERGRAIQAASRLRGAQTLTAAGRAQREEVHPVATIESAPPAALDKPEPPPAVGEARVPTERQRQVWDAVQRLGSQTAAARELGVTQGAIQSALHGYADRAGIEGPLPGRAPAPPAKEPKKRGPIPSSHCVNGHALSGDNVYIVPSSGQRKCKICKAASAAKARATAKADEQPVAALTEADIFEPLIEAALAEEPAPGPWRADELATADAARADSVFDAAAERWVDAPPLVRAAIDWLLEQGPTWTQEQAELWLRLFTSAIDLAYPTAA